MDQVAHHFFGEHQSIQLMTLFQKFTAQMGIRIFAHEKKIEKLLDEILLFIF